jgi:peptidoglycan glycosyltransferase
MNAPLRRIAVAVGVLLVAVLVNVNVIQLVEADSLRNNPHNSRILLREYSQQRGPIIVSGKAIAKSVKTQDALEYLRKYPGGKLYATATGFYSFVYGASAIEQQENDVLSGNDDQLFVRRFSDLLAGRKPQGGDVVLTLNPKAQQAATQALGHRKGAVVALDPTTGAILALVTYPTYDPAVLSSHNQHEIRKERKRLVHDPSNPLLDRALSARFPPGSTFKIVDTAAALAHGYTPDTEIPAPHVLPLPLTNASIHNFNGEVCSDSGTMSLADALKISCNTAFAKLGLKLGAKTLRTQAEKFGFNRDDHDPRVPMPTAASVFPKKLNAPHTAQSAIGQYDVAQTPLQAAMLAAAVANGGTLMKPYLVDRTLAPDLSVLHKTTPQVFSHPMSKHVAAQLKQMMHLVVQKGTGTHAQIPGVYVAGKTGTAEPEPVTAWFTAFAHSGGKKVAVAAVVPHAGHQGGVAAAPIVKKVIQAVLAPQKHGGSSP